MTTLYQLSANYREVQDLDLPEECLADTLESIEGEIEGKAENLLAVVRNLDADTQALDTEIKRLQTRKNTISKRQAWLKDYLKSNMQATGINKISCPLFTITLTKPPQVVVVDDEAAIPDALVKVETVRKIDKKALLKDLKAGLDIPGAHLGEGNPGLRIS